MCGDYDSAGRRTKRIKIVKDVVVETAEQVKAEKQSDIHYKIGTMIEIPRAALLADEIAQEAEFFSWHK